MCSRIANAGHSPGSSIKQYKWPRGYPYSLAAFYHPRLVKEILHD